MSLLRKLNTLFRASAQEPAERLVEANSVRIFEQEIRDAETAILQAKRQLAVVMAQKKQLTRHNEMLQESIERREQQACEAMEQQQNGLAEEVATLIAEEELILRDQARQTAHLAKQENNLKQQLRIAAQSIQKYRRELNLAKANRSAQQAISSLKGYSNGLSVSMQDMTTSLNRIQQQQTDFADFDSAMTEIEAEFSDQSLDKKLKQAGIKTDEYDAQAVLERLRKQRAA